MAGMCMTVSYLDHTPRNHRWLTEGDMEQWEVAQSPVGQYDLVSQGGDTGINGN